MKECLIAHFISPMSLHHQCYVVNSNKIGSVLMSITSLFIGLYVSGIAFPTCLSINNCVCHFSPLRSEGSTLLAENDLVKMWVNICSNSKNTISFHVLSMYFYRWLCRATMEFIFVNCTYLTCVIKFYVHDVRSAREEWAM